MSADWLGHANRHGEYCSFLCPRCGTKRTHAVPTLDLWRCWECEHFGSVKQLLALPRRPRNAAPGRAQTPRRLIVNLSVVEIPSA